MRRGHGRAASSPLFSSTSKWMHPYKYLNPDTAATKATCTPDAVRCDPHTYQVVVQYTPIQRSTRTPRRSLSSASSIVFFFL